MKLKGYSEEEIQKWSWLRAVEWSAWPSFLAMGIGQFMLLVITPFAAMLMVLLATFVWSIFCRYFVSAKLVTIGVFVNKLKWLSSPLVFIILLTQHETIPAFIALFWPFIAMFLQFLRLPSKVGAIQEKLLKQVYL